MHQINFLLLERRFGWPSRNRKKNWNVPAALIYQKDYRNCWKFRVNTPRIACSAESMFPALFKARSRWSPYHLQPGVAVKLDILESSQTNHTRSSNSRYKQCGGHWLPAITAIQSVQDLLELEVKFEKRSNIELETEGKIGDEIKTMLTVSNILYFYLNIWFAFRNHT